MYSTEYLPRINAISVVFEYDEPINNIVDIKLNSNNQLVVRFQDRNVFIDLPIPIQPNAPIKVASINQTAECICLNIALPSDSLGDVSEKTESFMDFSSSDLNQKWSCKDLKNKTPVNGTTSEFRLCCINCLQEVIGSRQHGRFFDMPSELWSEMMDFWHCHKPADTYIEKGSHRNYDGKLKPKGDDVIIGGYYFLLNPSSNFEVIGDDVKCQQCKQKLGSLDDNILKILKWNVCLKYGDTIENFPSYLYVYNMLLDKINLSAIRKFKVKSDSSKDYIFTWVMNIGVNASTEKGVLKNALKLFYYKDDISKFEIDNNESIELLNISDDVYKNFQDELSGINKILPISKKNITLKEGDNSKLFNIGFLAGFQH